MLAAVTAGATLTGCGQLINPYTTELQYDAADGVSARVGDLQAADLLIVNKSDLAPHVGVDVAAMVADAEKARDGRPVLALSRQDADSVERLCAWVRTILSAHRAGDHTPQDPGPMAPHSHAGEEHTHEHGQGHAHGHRRASAGNRN